MLTHYLDDHQLSRTSISSVLYTCFSRQTLSEKELGDASPLDPALKTAIAPAGVDISRLT